MSFSNSTWLYSEQPEEDFIAVRRFYGIDLYVRHEATGSFQWFAFVENPKDVQARIKQEKKERLFSTGPLVGITLDQQEHSEEVLGLLLGLHSD